LLFADEASFRQDPTLYQTWARRGSQPLIPTTGQRNTQKVFGAVEIRRPKVHFLQGEAMFTGQTYAAFLDSLARYYRRQEVFLVQDNAPYHDAPEVQAWLGVYGHRFHLVPLPKYSPDFNAVERIWHHVRVNATHNRYFPTKQEFVSTLSGALRDIANEPSQLAGYLQPFL
jgi:transposase